MKKIFKTLAITALIVTMSTLGLTEYYNKTLSDNYFIQYNESLSVNTFFTVTAKSNSVQNASARIGDTIFSSDKTLMLFDCVPIKEVSTTFVDSPLLVPCGEPFGIRLITDGVLVVELENSNDCSAAKRCGIQKGDIILTVCGKAVTSNKNIAQIIEQSNGEPTNSEFIALITDKISLKYRSELSA